MGEVSKGRPSESFEAFQGRRIKRGLSGGDTTVGDMRGATGEVWDMEMIIYTFSADFLL